MIVILDLTDFSHSFPIQIKREPLSTHFLKLSITLIQWAQDHQSLFPNKRTSKLFQSKYQLTITIKKQENKNYLTKKPNSHTNMQSVAGSNGINSHSNLLGTLVSDSQFTTLILRKIWKILVIELWQCGLELPKEESYTSPPTPTLIWMEMETETTSRISNINRD